MEIAINFIEKNIYSLSDDLKRKFLMEFKADIEKNNAYSEKSGIGTYILLDNLPDDILYKMHSFIQIRIPEY